MQRKIFKFIAEIFVWVGVSTVGFMALICYFRGCQDKQQGIMFLSVAAFFLSTRAISSLARTPGKKAMREVGR